MIVLDNIGDESFFRKDTSMALSKYVLGRSWVHNSTKYTIKNPKWLADIEIDEWAVTHLWLF